VFRIIPYLVLLFFFRLNSFGQGVSNVWLLGYSSSNGRPCGGSRIDFVAGYPDTSYEYRNMNFRDCNASICNYSGNLLFYTNGVYIANSLGDTMVNGSGLNPSNYTSNFAQVGLRIPQGDLIIPFPGTDSIYYLIHESIEWTTTVFNTLVLFKSIIDISMDSGRGVVVQKNIPLIQDTLLTGGITACKHANGRDWWVITHQYNSDLWYTLLITPYGINGPYLQNAGPVITESYFNQAAFSPDGTKFAIFQATQGLDLYNFDRCSGLLSNNVHVNFSDTINSGLAFSPNSSVLYISAMTHIYQFDLTSANIPASIDTVGVFDGFSDPNPPFYATFYLSQLAPDGKIYINTGNSTAYLHVINYPDSLGLSCGLQQHGLKLPTYNAFTIPNHPNYFLAAEGGTNCDSLPTSIINTSSNYPLELQVFPNPIIKNQEVNFIFSALSNECEITIFNINGDKMAQYNIPQWSSFQHIKLPELNCGIYLARLTSKELVRNVKLIVQ
jgi:hypothetical protein